MARTRIEIDLNDVDANGLTSVLFSDATGPLVVGEYVTAFEPEDDVAAPAMVQSIDHEHGIAYVRVQWDEMGKDIEEPVYKGLIVRVMGSVPASSSSPNGWGPFVDIPAAMSA